MKTKYQLWVPALLLLIAATSNAAQRVRGSSFQTDENGFAKAPAEFSIFTVGAVTHCAETATAANQAIRTLAGEIEEILKRFADASIDEGIQSFPGATAQGELNKYEGGMTVKICKGWNASRSYAFKLRNLDDIAPFQDAILELNEPSNPKRVIGLSAPKPGIFSKTYEALVDSALKDAHQKAQRRVRVLLEDMPEFNGFRLKQIQSTTNAAGSVAYDQTGLGGDPSLSALSSVTLNITRSFQFDLQNN